jgi:hypothetical protein
MSSADRAFSGLPFIERENFCAQQTYHPAFFSGTPLAMTAFLNDSQNFLTLSAIFTINEGVEDIKHQMITILSKGGNHC